MKILYFDCFSGAAGDMILAALLDAGADDSFVRSQLNALGIEGWTLEVLDVTRSGLRAKQVVVRVDEGRPPRDYTTIRKILDHADLHPEVRTIAQQVFGALARAEARVHGVDVERVHLHEVGATDALVDIVGSAAALVSLGPQDIAASPLAVGGGTTTTAHGSLPVPPPAVVEILTGIPLRGGGEMELVTPTGAAILATVAKGFGDLPPMQVEHTGYGAGSTEREIANVVRVLIGESSDDTQDRRVLLLETNLDDMNPELMPRVVEQLLSAGAQDAWIVPIVMKKGRPGVTLAALVPEQERERALDVFYAETTTFGVRITPVDKNELERTWVEVEVEGRAVRVKLAHRAGRVVTVAPEYEDALAVARSSGLPLKEIYRRASSQASASSSFGR